MLTSFAEAGGTGGSIAVWLPSAERLRQASASPFYGARESYSAPGNLDGSISNGDPTTPRVTFDGKPQAEAWFAVEVDHPATISGARFCHGRLFHDGGWWDASKGKPRIQVKKSPGGAWEDIAVIDSYPATTATDNKQLPDGKEFSVKFPPTAVVGIRAIGVPACGDNPKQAFASCAGLSD